MPEDGQAQSNAASNSPHDPPGDLEEAMAQLRVDNGPERGASRPNPYPDRPGEPDCYYYLRTGTCRYGSNCRYNHPAYTGQEIRYSDELPQREGQPDCQFFLKTGTCKYGLACKFHHPRDKINARPVHFNILGLPMREGEKSCPYYLKTAMCKFGVLCKFNHPQPTGAMLSVPGASAYGASSSSMVPSSGLPLISAGWPISRSPYVSSPRMQGLPSYIPFVLPPSPSTMPLQQSWTPYMEQLPSVDVVNPNPVSGSTSNSQSGPSIQINLPDRPDQPECLYYMKNGSCKYGSCCKYHHPKKRNQVDMSTIGPLGLPLRPGQPVCPHYTTHGICKYGPVCKFDHPFIGYYNYPLRAYSFQDHPVSFPDHQSSQVMLTSPESLPPSSTSRLADQHAESETITTPPDNDRVDPSRSSTSPENHYNQH